MACEGPVFFISILGTEYWTGWAPKVGRVRHRGLDEAQVPQIGRVLAQGVVGC